MPGRSRSKGSIWRFSIALMKRWPSPNRPWPSIATTSRRAGAGDRALGQPQIHEAMAAAEPALAMSGRSPRILIEMAAVHAARGDRRAADGIYQELRTRAQSSYVGHAELAAAAASAGSLDEARRLVTQAIEAGTRASPSGSCHPGRAPIGCRKHGVLRARPLLGIRFLSSAGDGNAGTSEPRLVLTR